MHLPNAWIVKDTLLKTATYGFVAFMLGGEPRFMLWLLRGLFVVSSMVSLVEAWRTGDSVASPFLTRIDQAAIFTLAALGLDLLTRS